MALLVVRERTRSVVGGRGMFTKCCSALQMSLCMFVSYTSVTSVSIILKFNMIIPNIHEMVLVKVFLMCAPIGLKFGKVVCWMIIKYLLITDLDGVFFNGLY